jgi:hypothetical protein
MSKPCPLCDRPFTKVGDLELHLRTAHKLEPDKLRHPTHRVLGPRVVAELVALVVIAIAAVAIIVFRDAVDAGLPHLRDPLLIFFAALCLGLSYHLYHRRAR